MAVPIPNPQSLFLQHCRPVQGKGKQGGNFPGERGFRAGGVRFQERERGYNSKRNRIKQKKQQGYVLNTPTDSVSATITQAPALRVLIADDDADTRTILTTTLAHWGQQPG